MSNIKVVEGSEAVALAVKACRPHVISAYPISPQTHIVEGLAKMVADGDINAEYVRVESEFSAASVLAGASAAGAAPAGAPQPYDPNRAMAGAQINVTAAPVSCKR